MTPNDTLIPNYIYLILGVATVLFGLAWWFVFWAIHRTPADQTPTTPLEQDNGSPNEP